MSPSEEILTSIENRLHQLEEEIAALQTARSQLQGTVPGPAKSKSAARRARKPGARKPAPAVSAPELSEEEWLKRRAEELAAQSRRAAAA